MKYQSSLSVKRIVISLLIFAMIPAVDYAVFRLTGSRTISRTFALSLSGWALLIYDWNLFGIHYNRAKAAPADTVIYTLVGCVLIGALTWVNQAFLQAYIPLPERPDVHAYLFASPIILIAHSFTLGLVINISFKCLTDHMDIRDREALIILASGFLFGFCYTAAFAPLGDFNLLIRTYLYNVLLISILSYLYNQSNSFIPGLLSFTFVMLILQYFVLFA